MTSEGAKSGLIRLEDGLVRLDRRAPAALLGDADEVPERGLVFVSLARWQLERASLRARGEVGLRVEGEAALESLLPELEGLSAVAIRIPKFTDGRAYSLARLLRERAGFEGELRAVGDVLYDQLAYLGRCGFDAFELRADQDAEAALSAFSEISVRYQPAADRSEALFRRRRRPPLRTQEV